jgi:hypothetical protein
MGGGRSGTGNRESNYPNAISADQRTVPIAHSGGRDRYATGLQHSVAKGLKSPAFFTRKKSRPDSSFKLYLTTTSNIVVYIIPNWEYSQIVRATGRTTMAKTQQIWEKVQSGEIKERNAKLPRTEGTTIISPKYAQNAGYLAAWRNYCKSTPKDQWPAWLVEDLATMTPRK